MSTRAERTLEKHGRNVVSIKDKIKELQEQLQQEKDREQEAKNVALVELVRNMNLSYSDVKEAVSMIKAQFEPAPPAPEPAAVIPPKIIEPEPAADVSEQSAVFSSKIKENSHEEID